MINGVLKLNSGHEMTKNKYLSINYLIVLESYMLIHKQWAIKIINIKMKLFLLKLIFLVINYWNIISKKKMFPSFNKISHLNEIHVSYLQIFR